MKPASSKRSAISLESVQEASSEPVYRRGVQYYRRKKVLKYEEGDSGKQIEALVIGSEPQPYKVTVSVNEEGQFKAVCSCPYFEEVCKHSVAVLLTHIARQNPGIRFDLSDPDRGKEAPQERSPRAKELLFDPRSAEVSVEKSDFVVGILVLEKPLALILGTIPNEPQGKVNILKVPSEIVDTFESDSAIHRLLKYLTSLPQTTKGMAGGHRIPRGEEGQVIGHMSLCARVINTSDGQEITFSSEELKPRAVLSETESGELLLRLEAVKPDGEVLIHPVFFMGQSCWILSQNVFYSIDLSPIHRLFQFFDSYGQMTVKLEIVPKFLAVDLSILMKRMEVRFDDSAAPFPIAIVEPPRVVIKLSEKRANNGSAAAYDNPLELSLGFAYGDLILPSRDETSAVEAELYTRTISESGQSVWVKRLWEQESQVRRFLTNLLPQRTVADRFFFVEEPALDAVYYLASEQCTEWEVSGWEALQNYRVAKDGLALIAKLSLKKNSYKFDFDIKCTCNGETVPFVQVIDVLFRNRNYVKLSDNSYARIAAAVLLSLLKTIGQSKDTSRPLYQALPILHALETHEIKVEMDNGFHDFVEKIHNFKQLMAVKNQ